MLRRFFSLPNNDPSNVQVDHFRTRLKARLFIIFIFIVQLVERIYFIYIEPGKNNSSSAKDLFTLSFPFLVALFFIIIIEFLLYKKLGSKILKYSNIIDGLFFICFNAEWLLSYYGALHRYKGTVPGYIGVSSIIAYSAISWRTLMQGLIVHNWLIKSIVPVAVYGISINFAVTNQPDQKALNIVRGISQAIYIVMIFYFTDKLSYKLLWVNLKQGKWMRINQFILDNIPEKIAIFNTQGQLKFTSEYFKLFLQKCNCSTDNIEKFFHIVKNLNRQFDVDSFNLPIFDVAGQPEKSTLSLSKYHLSSGENGGLLLDKMPTLDSLLKQFQSLIQSNNNSFQQKFFLVFSGTLKLEDSQERSLEIKISYINQDSQQYIILIIKDTTQRDMLVTLENTNKYKDQLLASVSHELRTPLNGNISLVTAALRDHRTPNEIKENFLKPALKSSKFLLHLINDILDFAQIRARKLRLIFKMGNLHETLRNSLQLLDLQAQVKRLNLEINLDPKLPFEICTDHVRLSQIILNLLNNSIKFTKQGFVRLTAEPETGTENIKITVEDSGIGMKDRDMKTLFQAFTHIDHEDMANINPSGVGLGLSIAYNLAELLGPAGNKGIKVSSILDQGSVFSFVVENRQLNFPQTVTEDEKPTNEEISLLKSEAGDIATEPVLDLKKLSYYSRKSFRTSSGIGLTLNRSLSGCCQVLLVDDDTFNILAYKSILKALGVGYECCFNGKSAVEKISEEKCGEENCTCFSVVFMDQEMPEMSGIEAVKEIRKLEKQKKISKTVVIGCTAHDYQEKIDEFLKAGINECIKKPVSMEEIQRIVENYLS